MARGRSRITHHASLLASLLLALSCFDLPAAEVDPSRLPPPAAGKIDFDRDVRPVFERSCFRCHGPEKPKSHFRLDNRELALKGGDNNSDNIIPGDSARSRLIHYVARVAEDLEMPPPGKADPLTPEQVGVLRAWIDQGADWGAGATFPQSAFSISPTLRWMDVDGDRRKFREIEGIREGWGGGVEQFSIQEQLSADRRMTAEGRVLFPDRDVRVKLALEQTDVGFVRGGFEVWRQYYDDTGGFYPFTNSPASFDLDRDLHLDVGRAWIDFGLRFPDSPQVVLGYEFQFKDGAKSMLEWGPVIEPGNPVPKNIYPAAKDIDEQTHIVKLDVLHEFDGWRLEDNARVEFHTQKTLDRQIGSYSGGPGPDSTFRTRQDYTHVQGANALRMEKQITDWWFGSGGYLYSRLAGGSSLDQVTLDPANVPMFGNLWRDRVVLRREAHVFSLASLFQPADGLSLSLNVQNEFSRQEGFGDIHLDFDDPNNPGTGILQPATVRSDLDQTTTSQNVLLRYLKVPFTVLFAEARFSQDRIGHFEQESGAVPDEFLRDTDYFNHREDYRAGFNTSPRRWVAFNAHYRHRNSDSDYDHVRDTNSYTPPGDGYSAFIRHREIRTDEVEARLVLRPASWLKTTFWYRLTASDFFTDTDPVNDFNGDVSAGGRLRGGRYRAHVYGLNAVFVPSQRLYLSGTFTYSDGRTTSWAQGTVPSIVAPYEGGTYSVMASANYALNSRTALQGSYLFSRSDYGQDNAADGLPVGLDYTRHGVTGGITRRLRERFTLNLRYGVFRYDERNTGGGNDFTAQGVFATVVMKWP